MSQRSRFRVAVLFLMFFVISLLTNIIGPLVPDIIHSFNLSLTMAAFLPFSFFAAYGVMSIPAGVLVEKRGEKPVLAAAFVLIFVGAVTFCLMPFYSMALLSLFAIGLGMAALQVAINPLLRVAGGEEHYAFNAVLSQLVFGLASFVGPLIYSHFATSLGGEAKISGDFVTRALASVVPPAIPWIAVYWIFSLIALAMVGVVIAVKFPRVDRTNDEKVGALKTHIELLKQPIVWLYFVGIFSYVGLEQGISNWMSEFLAIQHGFNPQIQGADAVSKFWGFMMIGCVFGLIMLKFFDSRKILILFCIVAFATLATAIFGPKEMAIWMFAMTGFALSVMWSIVFSLALNSVPKNHGTFSGILCTGIIGGALLPLLIGNLGDHTGLRTALCVLFVPLAYIFTMGIWARPLIQNKTLLSPA